MQPSRRGKIARLPRAIREELNHRLDEGEPQKNLVGWLNSLPEVTEILRVHFEGKAIRPQNLSEWKQGGYRDWRAQLEARDIARCLQEDADADQGEKENLPSLLDSLTFWLTVRLAAETRRIAEAEPEESWKRLRQFSREIAVLRRGDLQRQRLELERQREQRKAGQEKACRETATPAPTRREPGETPFGGYGSKLDLMQIARFEDEDPTLVNFHPGGDDDLLHQDSTTHLASAAM